MPKHKSILDRLSEGRQYRDIDLSQIELRESQDGDKTVEGYATTFNTPYVLWSYDGYTVMEQIDREAFKDCDMSDVIMQYNHEGRVFARTSNGTLEVSPDLKGLHMRGNLGGTELGNQVYEEINGGYTNKMSIGFKVGEDKREVTEDHENNTVTVLRTITKISKLYDVSAVSLPANDATSISARDFGNGLIEEIKQELLARGDRERRKRIIKMLTEV